MKITIYDKKNLGLKEFEFLDSFIPSEFYKTFLEFINKGKNDQYTYIDIVIERDVIQKEFEGFQEYIIRK